MSPRAYVYAVAVAVGVSLFPAGAHALTVTDLSVNGASPVAAGSTVDVVCTAVSTGTMLKDIPTTATFSGSGAFAPVTASFTGTTSYTASTRWTAPLVPGTYPVRCDGVGSRAGTSFLQVDATVEPASVPVPEITSFSPPPRNVLLGSSNPVSVVANDPTATYAWTATGGTFTDAASASTQWIAPTTQGDYTLTVTVSNAGGSVARDAPVTTALSLFQGGLSATMQYPRRVAATPEGDLLAVDDLGNLVLMTKRGDRRGSIPDLTASAVTVGGGAAFVATRTRGILKLDPATGRQIGSIPWRSSSNITGLAYDGARRILWASVYEARRVIAFRADGSRAMEIATAEGRALRSPADVAIDVPNDTLWVAEKDGLTGNRLHAYSAADGTWLRSMVTSGLGAGQVVDTGGIVLDPAGRVFVSDAYGCTVQVMSSAGAFIGTIGSRGDVDGYLLQPRGLAFMANGNLAIANSWFNRIDAFGTQTTLPTCDGDADCDGLPDAWEDANLAADAKNDPANGLVDADGDGLNCREEYALRTNPNRADTDGDGVSDSTEVASGFDPLDAGDHQTALTAGSQGRVPPGLVRLSATATNAADCSALWRQVGGPSVTLRDATTLAPSFVARGAGTYRFEAAAMCGTVSSAPAMAQVEVENAAPRADAGRTVATAPGRAVVLSAGFSSDANGDTLSYSWSQRLGPATTVSSRGSSLTVRPMREGYYEYAVTARDRAGATATSVVGVVVADGTLPSAIVSNPVITATAGGSVTLDASGSVPADATFAWSLVEPAGGVIATTPSTSVTIPAAGRYVFEVTAMKDGVSSPPARVVVLAGEGGALPTASASAPLTGTMNSEITLDGAGSAGTSLTYSWRQVAGPAAGLSHADSAVATAVPFAPGVYAFELTVTDGAGAVSAPAVVRIDVSSAGNALPVARVVAPASAVVGELVVLNARSSTSASRYRWSQVAGPWVALDCTSATPVFSAAAAGTYAFELVVDDGQVRSAPVTVTIDVQ